ncbi:MAG TPA: TonB-dependent receptor [Ohtaekwangia sp.]|nr:TonB-dependent receptor [Ohtaekwangia sp.]
MKKVILLKQLNLKNLPRFFRLLYLMLFVLAGTVAQAQNTVSGTVTDETGAGLPGVNVLVKGTTIGTTSDANGQYSVSIPTGTESPVLLYSFIGYTSEEVPVGGKTTVDVQMVPSIESLQEIVVVGYGVQKKSDVTGSLVSVSGEELQEVPVANIQQALQGRAVGVEVQRVGTAPGAGARIRVRGERTIIGSNDPLIVLDGIPFEGNLSDINQDEIASLNVLKDASATAIYGSRGANGVVLITTKRGKSGETRVTLNSYYGVTTVAKKYDMFNAEEYAAMRDAAGYSDQYMPLEVEGMARGRNTDWQELMYEDGIITNHNLGISGGNEKGRYAVSGGYYKETTILPGQDFERYSLKTTFDNNIGERIKIGLNSMNSISYSNGTQFVNGQGTQDAFGGGLMYPILSMSPLMPAYDANGEILLTPAGNQTDGGNYNPLLLKSNNDNWTDRIRRFRSFNSAFAEVEIIKGLKYRLNMGFDFSQNNSAQFQGRDSYFRTQNQSNRARVGNDEQISWTAENIITYDKTFADDHRLSFTGLYSAQQSKSWGTAVGKDSVTSDFIQYYNLNMSSPTSNLYLAGREETWGLLSFMGRVNYAFKDRYLFTYTFRRDGSSRLANKWHNYQAVAAGWNIAQEAFFQNQDIVSDLKLRVSYGQTSNQSVRPYTTLGGVSGNNGGIPIRYNYGTSQVVGFLPTRIPDTSLDWEYTNTLNIGLDFGLLEDRITGSVEWYNAQTDQLLYNVTLPITGGYQDPMVTNLGRVENKGVEVAISANIITSNNGGFTWSADLNWFVNRNKLLELAPGEERSINNGLHVGHPLSAIYDFKKLGIWQLDEADAAAEFGQLPGELKLADISGPNGEPDGVLSEDYDRVVIGDQQADWQGGITNRFTYKGFDLSFVTYARFGGLIRSHLHAPNGAYLTNNTGLRNGLDVDYWTPENPTNWFPAPNSLLPGGASGSWSTLGYYDASFIRVRSINLGYSLSNTLTDKIHAQSLRVYFTVQNPFLLYAPYVTKYNGVDPEPTGQGNSGAVSAGPGVRANGPNQSLGIGASTPPVRSFILGINVTF